MNEQNQKNDVTYKVGDEQVILNRAIVRAYLTRGNPAAATDAEIVQFMCLCKANGLNPFVGDAFFVKSERMPAQMVTSKEAFMKRAETGANYGGFQAGVIVLREKEIKELEGSFYLPSDTLIGGWCKVMRKDRDFPIVARVRLDEYNTGKSTWAGKPGTMIRKVAIAQAFREAYPMNLGGMYIQEETNAPDDQMQTQPVLPPNSQEVTFEALPETAAEPEPVQVAEPEPVPVQAYQDRGDNFDANLFNPDYKA